MNNSITTELVEIINHRKTSSPDQSYVASLFKKGLDAILKKVGEEAAEVIIAAKNHEKSALVHEIADLYFHSLVMMSALDITMDDVKIELQQRLNVSGLTEKSQRKEKS